MLGVTFTEDAAQHINRFMAEVRPPYPIGMSTRGRALDFLDVAVDDGRQLPNLVLIDPRGVVKTKLAWNDPALADPAKQMERLASAIESVRSAPVKKKSS